MTCKTLIDSVLKLRSEGLSVIPVHAPGMFGPLGIAPDQSGKSPLVPWKEFQDRVATEAELCSWWEKWPMANVGVVTGQVSGLFVVDVDGPDGIASLQGYELPETKRSATGRGTHFWFKHPGSTVPNLVKVLPGVDIRGDGGLVVAPPSIHWTGARYAWANNDGTPLAEPPSWVRDLLQNATASGSPLSSNESQTVVTGHRNDYLYRVARSLHSKGLSPVAIRVALLAENLERCSPPLLNPEVETIATKATSQAHQPGFLSPNAFLSPKGGNGKETNFAPLSAYELLNQPPEEVQWNWESYLPKGGLGLLTAYMKVGKSTFLYPLLVAIAQGRPFLDYSTTKCGVLILAVEEHPRDVRIRLEASGLQPQDPLYVHAWRLEHGPSTLAALKDFIEQNAIGVVVLDTLSRYWAVLDENNNAQVLKEVSPFLDLARETGCSVLLVHHDRKGGGEDGRGIRGASSLLGLVDQALMLEKRQGGKDNQRVLRTVGRYADTPKELVIEWENNQYSNLGTPPHANRHAIKHIVLNVLGPTPLSMKDVLDKTGLSRKSVQQALEDLGNEVHRDGTGKRNDPYTYRRV